MSRNFHEDTEIFAAIVDCDGFGHAAKQLGISPALVSRRIRALEKELTVTLLTRSTRKFELTAEGVLLYQHAKKIMLDKETTLHAIETLSSKPSGLLKISAPMNFGRRYMASALCEFMKIYPEIEVDLRLSNKRIDMIGEKFDLIIRGAGYLDKESLAENNLIAKQLLSSPIILCASPDFIQRHKKIQTTHDIQGLLGIDFNPTPSDAPTHDLVWEAKDKNKVIELKLKKQLSCNDIDTTIKMACEGNGIAKVALINIENEIKTKTLVQVLPTINLGKYNLFAVFPQRTLPQRTRKLLAFFERQWG
jgi:DNA-binding transcriptional LysR family regulator